MADIVTLSYGSFLRHFAWSQGEHVIAIGPTGCGKTTLMRSILPRRKCVVLFATKVHDESLNKYKRDGFTIISDWPWKPKRPWQWDEYPDKILLWPRGGNLYTVRNEQKRVFTKALADIYSQGRWTVVFDEAHYMATELGLKDELAMLHHQGRSNYITIVDGSQRPAFLPVVVYSSASHAFLWRTREERDFKRLSDMGGINSKLVENVVTSLEPHQFVYINTRSDLMVVSKVARTHQ